MADVKERPAVRTNPAHYDDDFYRWAREQAELLQEKRFGELDVANLIDEIEDMAKATRRSLESSYRLVALHLLKWTYQPALRSRSWRTTIVRERGSIEIYEEENPSLAAEMPRRLERIYRRARKEAASETDLPITAFPADCPYTLAQLRDDEYLPD